MKQLIVPTVLALKVTRIRLWLNC